jgi:hypothetical protein
MVVQRLNDEIGRRNSLGERNLPPSQSINGIEMFGFLSPPIVQVYFYMSYLISGFCYIELLNLIAFA